MKRVIYFIIIILLTLCISCEREHKNIFDPENDDTVFLKAPQNLRTEIIDSKKIKLQWTGITGINYYKIDRCFTEMQTNKKEEKAKNWQVSFATTSAVTFTDTLIAESGTYEYRVYGFKTNRNTLSSNVFQNIVLYVNNPVISLNGGTYNSDQTVSVLCTTPGAEIHYTTDGTEPGQTSALYSVPLTINKTCVLKTIAMKTGWTSSPIKSAQYHLI